MTRRARSRSPNYGTYGLPQCACVEVHEVNFPYTQYAGIAGQARLLNDVTEVSTTDMIGENKRLKTGRGPPLNPTCSAHAAQRSAL